MCDWSFRSQFCVLGRMRSAAIPCSIFPWSRVRFRTRPSWSRRRLRPSASFASSSCSRVRPRPFGWRRAAGRNRQTPESCASHRRQFHRRYRLYYRRSRAIKHPTIMHFSSRNSCPTERPKLSYRRFYMTATFFKIRIRKFYYLNLKRNACSLEFFESQFNKFFSVFPGI